MNKQKVIEEIKSLEGLTILDKTINFDSEMIPKKEVLDIVKQLDEPVRPPEPEKPKVPQFVAEYIEYCKHEKFYALHGAYANMDDRLKCWRFKGNNSELFAKAWLYGYEKVEKEKLYTVEIPNNDETKHFGLRKRVDGEVCIGCYGSDNWQDYKYVQLTETEIKKDFAWAWQFAKEVEE